MTTGVAWSQRIIQVLCDNPKYTTLKYLILSVPVAFSSVSSQIRRPDLYSTLHTSEIVLDFMYRSGSTQPHCVFWTRGSHSIPSAPSASFSRSLPGLQRQTSQCLLQCISAKFQFGGDSRRAPVDLFLWSKEKKLNKPTTWQKSIQWIIQVHWGISFPCLKPVLSFFFL